MAGKLMGSRQCRLDYYFNRWSKALATYSFGMFDSNKGNIDHTVNRVMLSLSVGY